MIKIIIAAAAALAVGLSIGLTSPAFARTATAPTAQQCANAQLGVDNLRKLATQHPEYAAAYNAMANRSAQAARASGCPNVH
jgi:hypothetical protein